MQPNHDVRLAVKESDYQKLIRLIESTEVRGIDQLEGELARAEIIDDAMYPADTVCLGAKVRFIDFQSNREREITLVMPHEANVQEMKISILTPMGQALIGMYAEGIIEWEMPNHRPARIKVLSVRQPSS